MKVHVNANCISCGLCVSLCPNVFHITEGGTAAVPVWVYCHRSKR